MDRLPVTASLSLDPAELTISFIRASGPGGQNVNKVSTAAQLRFNLDASPSLPESVKVRARHLAGSRLTTEGEIVITADRYRTQILNRDDAIERRWKCCAMRPFRPSRAARPGRRWPARRDASKARASAAASRNSDRSGRASTSPKPRGAPRCAPARFAEGMPQNSDQSASTAALPRLR